MPQASLAPRQSAGEPSARFPNYRIEFGDVLAILPPERSRLYYIDGLGCDNSAFGKGFDSGVDVDEARCGRDYAQGMSTANDTGLEVLFDKVAAPADH